MRARLVFVFVLLCNAVHIAYAQEETVDTLQRMVVDSAAVVGVDTAVVDDDPRYRLNKAYIASYWTGLKYVASRPAHWQKKDWLTFSGFMAATGGLMAADWEIRHFMQNHRSEAATRITNTAEPFGNLYGTYFFPAMYVAGLVTHDRRVESVGLIGAKSLVISTLIYTASKSIIRRRRPDEAYSQFDYAAPFHGPRYTSSPSGHSNTIFTVATTLALAYKDTKWVPVLSYGVATLTAVSRVYQNRHWASDVLVGSVLGHFVTKAVWKSCHREPVVRRIP